MAHFQVEKYAETISRKERIKEIGCRFETCPKFEKCQQLPSSFLGLNKDKARVFFLTDHVSLDEDELNVPCVNLAGKVMRENFITPFIKKTHYAVPYLVTKTFRAYNENKPPKAFEAKLCFSHLLKEIKWHSPELVVAFGVGAWKALYEQAVNKDELPLGEEHNSHLRGKTFKFVFEDGVEAQVYSAFSPGLVVTSPASIRYVAEDCDRISALFNPALKGTLPEQLVVKAVQKLETVKEVFDYLDFLRYEYQGGLIAFDTETENLNRRFNNRFLTWQFSHEEGKAVVFPISHKHKPLFREDKEKALLVEKMNGLFNASSKDTKISWWVGHNIKFDLSLMLGLMNIMPRHPDCVPWWDTMLGMHWLDENRKSLSAQLPGSPYGLKTLGIEFFNFKFEEESLEKRGDGALEELALDQLYIYGGSDVVLTRALAQKQAKLAAAQPGNALEALKKFQKYYYFPASRAISVMECNGIYIKTDQLEYLQAEDSPIWTRLSEIDKEMQNLPDVLEYRRRYKDKIGGIKAGSFAYEDLWGDSDKDELPKLDLNKQDQQKYFYLDYLKFTPRKFSKKTGQPTLNSAFLEHYMNAVNFRESPLIKEKFAAYYSEIVGYDEKDGSPLYKANPIKLESEYRKLKRLGTGYLDSMEGFLRNPRGDSVDSRIRASYHLHGTDTGRWSSSNPNLQQLPSGKVKLAKEVKNMFQAEPPSAKYPEGTCLIQGDYKTAEVRWAALFAQDTNLISIFSESAKIIEEATANDAITDEEFENANFLADLHRRTASLMSGLPLKEITKAHRQGAKCLVGSTMLYTNKGIIPIESLVKNQNDEVWLQNVEGVSVASRYGPTEILRVNHKWVDETIEIETDLGLKVEGDPDHPLVVWRECQMVEVPLKDIQEGDLLVVPRSNELGVEEAPTIDTKIDNAIIPRYPTKMCNELARILGYMVAEGDTQNFVLGANTKLSAEMLEDFSFCLKECFDYDYDIDYKTYKYSTNSVGRLPVKIRRYLEALDLKPSYAATKRVPEIIFRSCREDIIHYLRAYFEGDGTVKTNSIVVMSASEAMMIEVQQLLLSLNIASVIFSEERLTPVGKEMRTYYGLRLRTRDAHAFARTVGFVSKSKIEKALKISNNRSHDFIYGLETLLSGLRAKYKTDYRGTYFSIGGKMVKFGERVTKEGSEVTHKWLAKNEFVLDALKVWSEETNNNVYRDVSWLHKNKALLAPVTKKSLKSKRQKVFDIEVADMSHTFYASGILSQNCITFGLLFGMTVKTLAVNNGWALEEAEEKLAKYFSAFPDLEKWLKAITLVAKRQGYVETFMGRRRRLDHLFSINDWKFQTDAERKAMNTSIQGQSSDAGAIGMFTFLRYILDNNLEDRWLIQNVVHDSCLVQVPKQDVREALQVMKKCFVKDMQKYIETHWNCELAIPIEMEFEIGLKYGVLKAWDGRRKTLDKILAEVDKESVDVWKVKTKATKPPKSLDMVSVETM